MCLDLVGFLVHSDILCLFLIIVCRSFIFKAIIDVAELIALRQTQPHTLKSAHVYPHTHSHTCTPAHTLILSLAYTVTLLTLTLCCRGWWEAQKGHLSAPGHTAQLGQAWNDISRQLFPFRQPCCLSLGRQDHKGRKCV